MDLPMSAARSSAPPAYRLGEALANADLAATNPLSATLRATTTVPAAEQAAVTRAGHAFIAAVIGSLNEAPDAKLTVAAWDEAMRAGAATIAWMRLDLGGQAAGLAFDAFPPIERRTTRGVLADTIATTANPGQTCPECRRGYVGPVCPFCSGRPRLRPVPNGDDR